MPSSARLARVASGAFVLAYLGFQLVYPTLAWMGHGNPAFAWDMYSGLRMRPDVSVVFADGSLRDLGLLTRRGNAVRVLGSSVDVERFAPAHVCALWPDAREVRFRVRDRESAVPCPPRS
jgi:hypothetical protein